MIRTSEQTSELMKALAGAQGKFGAAIKNSQNPAFRSKYADLSAVIDATLEHLNAAGVVVMQHPSLDYKGEGDNREAFVTVTTRLQLGAEWLESDIAIPAVQRDRFDAQSVGSAITYGCRYALQSILVVPREDDDGNQAVGRGTSEAAKAVGEAKLAKLKETREKANGKPAESVPTLFYTSPSSMNGHFVEFVNIQSFLSARPASEESLRLIFSAHKAKKTKSDTALVPAEHLQPLLEQLVGEMGIVVKELKPGPGSE